MINSCYELMSYIHSHCKNDIFYLMPNANEQLGLSKDDLSLYVEQLVSYGYAKRNIRHIVLTNSALDYLDN